MKSIFLPLFIRIFMILMVSCSSSNPGDFTSAMDSITNSIDSVLISADPTNLSEFENYLELFPEATIPFVVLNPDSLADFATEKEATLFNAIRGRTFFNSLWSAYKRIPAPENVVALLSIENGLAYNKVLLLETYTKEGAAIDKKYLDFGFEENGDPAGSVEFKKEFNFHVFIRSVHYNSEGKNTQNSDAQKEFSHSMQGTIQSDGKIQLSQKIWINK